MGNVQSLTQKKFLSGKRFYEFTENKEVKVLYSSIISSNEEIINLYDLDPNFIQINHREIKYLILGVILLFCSFPIFVNSYNLKEIGVSLFSLFFLIPSFIFFIEYHRNSYKQTIVKYYNNGENAILFWLNKPNKKEFEKFTHELMDKINSLKLNPKLNIKEKLEIYSNHLLFLVDEEVISKDEYDSIMKRTEKKINNKTADVIKIVK